MHQPEDLLYFFLNISKVETIKTVKEVTKTIVGGNSKKDYIIGRYNNNNMLKMLYKVHNKDVFYYYKIQKYHFYFY